MRYYIFYLYLIIYCKNLFCQINANGFLLPTTYIEDSKLYTHSIATNIDSINVSSYTKSQTLSDLIERNSAIYLKKYGALSTPTFRGTSSSHTLVLWNGVPINSVANGLIDAFNVPVSNLFITKLVHGGDGSVFGSGAIGGSIHLDNSYKFKKNDNLNIIIEQGSYGLNSNSVSFKSSNDKIFISSLLNRVEDMNQFTYINTSLANNPLDTNSYGKIKSEQYQFNFAYKNNSFNTIRFNYWRTYNNREVAQNMTIINSDAKQYDETDRVSLTLLNYLKYFDFKIQQSYLKEKFNYTELSKSINSYYSSSSYITDIDLKKKYNNILLNIGSLFTNNSMYNNNYLKRDINENYIAVYSALQFYIKGFKSNMVLRQEWHSTFKSPILSTIALEKRFDNIRLRYKFNKNFRIPTFNDRYWFSSGAIGNIDLLPELAYSNEFGFDLNSFIDIHLTAYNINISNMILWRPLEGFVWQAINIKNVRSRGLETKFSFFYNNLKIDVNYFYTKSTNENNTNNYDLSFNKQLLYVPKHKVNLLLNYKIKKYNLYVQNTYTDKVITSYGFSEDNYLDAFNITDIIINSEIKNTNIGYTLQLKNVFDVSYQTYLNYPNPGREYLLTFNFKF